MDDIRDRLARAEQDIKNSKENFHSFKAEDFGSLKREVHAMRGELNDKIDTIIENQNAMKEALNERVAAINIMIAKWAGALGVLIFIGKIAFEKLFC